MRKRHASWSEPVLARELELPSDGDAQTAATISLMREFSRADASTPPVHLLASSLPPAGRAAVDAVFWTVRRRIGFRRDSDLVQGVEGWSPETIEVLIRPVDMLSMHPAEGDCDDFSMLVAALLVARGVPCSFATVAADPLEPARYSHVYVVAHLPGGDVAVDASHGSRPGWECPNEFGKRRLWRVDDVRAGLAGSDVPFFSTTATAAMPSDVPWWQQLANRGIDFLQGRYGLPENTYVVNQGGVISRGSSQTPAAVPVTDVRGSADFSGISGNVLLLGGFVLLLMLILMRKGGK